MAQLGFDTRLSGSKAWVLNAYVLLFIEKVLNLHMIIKQIQGEDQIVNVTDLHSHPPREFTLTADVMVVMK